MARCDEAFAEDLQLEQALLSYALSIGKRGASLARS